MTTHATTISRLDRIDAHDLRRLISGYVAHARYTVAYEDAHEQVRFVLRLTPLDRPLVKRYDYVDDDLARRYAGVVAQGHSLGVYEGDLLVGLAIAEPHHWNGTLWMWEFHIAETHRRRGLGRKLMGAVVAAAEAAGLRAIVCETQTTNVPAIEFYRRAGFHLEGVDISYYSNADYPDGEVAVFMKRRLARP